MRRRLPLALAALLLLALVGALAFVLDRRRHRLHEPLWTAPGHGVEALEFVTPETLGLLDLQKVELRDAATGRVVREVALEDFPTDFTRAFLRGGHVVALVDDDIRIWSLETGKHERTLTVPHDFGVSAALDEIATATITSDTRIATVSLLDVRDRAAPRTIEPRGKQPANEAEVELSADGRLVLARTECEGSVETSIWSSADGRRLGGVPGWAALTETDELFLPEARDGTCGATIASLDGTPRRRFTLTHQASGLVHDIVLDARDGDPTVAALDVQTGEKRRFPFRGPPTDFAVSRASNRIAFLLLGDPELVEVYELFP